MLDKALELLEIFDKNGYEAYIVGGFVRDRLLGKKTNDIDICTIATPKEILEIFDNVIVSDMHYGSVVISYKGINFDVTTFRKDIKYESNRKPVKIKYIKDIKKDLLRRDFTVNTLCMNVNGEIIDYLCVREDLDNKILRTVGNPKYRIKEDALRILRCVRFATILDFEIEDSTKYFITKYRYLLKNLSMNRKREELDRIFLSKNKERGRSLLISLDLVESLNINRLKDIKLCSDLLGIWTQLEVDDIYPFTKYEKEEMKKLRTLLESDSLSNYLLYKYGLYLCTVYSDIKGISKRKINTMYNNLPIYSKKDIKINGNEIINILNKKPGKYVSEILDDIEKKIIDGVISNDKEELKEYIVKEYIEKVK